MKSATAILAFLCLLSPAAVAAELCQASCDEDGGECVFNVNVNLMEGQLGYYVFDECPALISPDLGMEVGQTYTFKQSQVYNYFHPIGFAYYADGAHDDVDELEPGIAPPETNSSCSVNLTCPAPMYFINGSYLGTYSNIPEVADVTTGEDNFGLDDYEPRFFWPFTEWLEQGDFEVKLCFHDEDFRRDIFYFCHIHQFMTGRIKLLKNGVPLQSEFFDIPELPYEYDTPSDYDLACGTVGLEDYRLPNAQCPDRFVCGANETQDETVALFSDCIDSMNCKMLVDMTTGVSAESEVALFLHQMIPHHENAINMAKSLLQSGDLDSCTDYLDDEDPKCLMFDTAISIVNGQNFQIQQMRGLIDSMGYPETDDCTVTIAESK